MGGMGIFRVGADGLNLGSITETLNRHGTTTVMVQRYLPEIVSGDKRILVIAGAPVPHCLARIPQGSEIRGNLAAGGKGVAQPLSARDLEIAETFGPILAARRAAAGGLDVTATASPRSTSSARPASARSATRPASTSRRRSSTRWRRR